MGVYACLLISLLLIFQTHSISSLSNASNSSQDESLSNSNHSFSSQPVQQHHQLLVSRRGGGEENMTAARWIVSKAKGGRSGSRGAGANNHRPGKANQKNAATSSFESNIIYFAANFVGLLLFYIL